jgi:hypothetical protein
LKFDIISEQENVSLKVKEQVNLKFKSEGNKIQFRFNEEIGVECYKECSIFRKAKGAREARKETLTLELNANVS